MHAHAVCTASTGDDLAFTLALIRVTGGAGRAVFLALPVIAGLQSCDHGPWRGLAVAAVPVIAYLGVVWPTLHGARVFDPSFTTRSEGTGLGLSISYGIVRDHEGTVDVETGEERGTRFVLAFPAAPEGRQA